MKKVSLVILFCFLFVFSVTSFVSAEPITVGSALAVAGAFLVAKDVAENIGSTESDLLRTAKGGATGAATIGFGAAAIACTTSLGIAGSFIFFPAAIVGGVAGAAIAWWAGSD